MEILNPKQQVLTNYEVLETLKKIKNQKIANSARNLATITYETVQYLEELPCKNQTQEKIENFITEVQKFKILTKSEILLMINDPPSLPLHINLIVEDSDDRGLSETQINEIISLSQKYLLESTTT